MVRVCFFSSFHRVLILGGSGGVGTFAIQVRDEEDDDGKLYIMSIKHRYTHVIMYLS